MGFKKAFKKLNGGYFGIFAAIAGIIVILTASILYFTAEPFTFFSHWISNLGGIVTNAGQSPNGSNVVFSIGLIFIAFLSLPFIVDLAKKMLSNNSQKFSWLVICATLAGAGAFLGIIGVALFDMKSGLYLHSYFSMIFFTSAGLMMFLFSLAMFFNSKISWKQATIGVIASGITFFFLLTFIPYLNQPGNVINVIASAGPELAMTRFFEWMFLFSLLFWFMETGIYSLRLKF